MNKKVIFGLLALLSINSAYSQTFTGGFKPGTDGKLSINTKTPNGSNLFNPLTGNINLNIPTSILSLDSNNNINYPIVGLGQFGQGNLPKQSFPNSTAGGTIQNSAPSITMGSWADQWLGKDGIMFGGHQEDDSRPVNIYAEPYGPANTGTVLTVNMDNRIYAGMRAGIAPDGPDGYGGIDGYPDFDAVGIFNYAGSMPPRFTANSVVKDAEGNTHAVTFDSSHAYFSPALPPEWISLLRLKMHVMTNIVGANNSDPNPHNRQPINTWAGEISGWAADGSSITVSGWRVLGSSMGPGNYTPGQATPTVPANTYDTTKSNYNNINTLFVGVQTKVFNRNTMCTLDNKSSPSDINSPKGTLNTQVQECEADEIDLLNNMDDYKGRMHGITVSYGSSKKPTDDSYDLGLFGQNSTMLRIWGGANTTDIWGDAIWVHGDGGVSGTTAGSTQETGELNSYADGTNDMRLVTWNTRNVDKSKQIGYTSQTMDLGYIVDGSRGHITGDGSNQYGGTLQSHIEFNPVNYQGGLALCGYTKCSLFARSDGDIDVTNNIKAGALVLPIGDYNDPNKKGAEYLTDTAGDVVLGSGQPNSAVISTIPLETDTIKGTHPDNIIAVKNTVSVPNLISNQIDLSTSNIDSTNLVTGQGNVTAWNTINSGVGNTDFINVNPNVVGGFRFYDTKTGNIVSNSDELMKVSKSEGFVSDLPAWFNGDSVNLQTGSLLNFRSSSNINSFYESLSKDGLTLNIGSQLVNGANLAGINNINSISTTTNYINTNGIGSKDTNGTVTFTSAVLNKGVVTNNATVTDANIPLGSLPSSGPDGSHLWCVDCKVNGIVGVEAYYHASINKWTDSQNNSLSN